MYSLLLTVALAATCTLAARLDNSYLPPRGTAGAGVGLVGTPFRASGGVRYSGGGGIIGGGSVSAAGRYSGGGAPSAPAGPVIPIISYENNPNQGDGVYSYRYETGNGISAEESGRPSAVSGPEGPGTAAQGSYSYTGPDGVQYTITYTADENGFQAQGAHLPTPPPIPPEILKSLQVIQAANAAGGGAGAYNAGAGAYNAGAGSYTGGAGSSIGGGSAFRRPTQSYSPATGYQYRK
ncbi:hypothetical protein O3M35_000881 [Rhynocoris fuscipes]|uniref:Uncharacterized protein n=1 Tax=Rhynocoris fuscipes TaxID=488301 RepID=A0AAW1DQY8_9HEMI